MITMNLRNEKDDYRVDVETDDKELFEMLAKTARQWNETKGRASKKKLFISCPMKGRTEKAIKESMAKLHKLAEVMMGEGLEVIDSFIEDAPEFDETTPASEIRLWYLGESIKMMAEADVVIGCPYIGCNTFIGCDTELKAALDYGKQVIRLSEEQIYLLMPDLWDIVHANYTATPVCGR